jgi:DNA repair photolyase
MEQPELPIYQPDNQRPLTLGHARIEFQPARSILTKATGFMGQYDYTLNPYSGCSFGCTYCYAAFFTRTVEQRDTWGYWVQVKENALALMRRVRTPLQGKSIYMSSVTDPYQPIERRLGLVRSLLQELVTHQPRLVVQTRSPVVTRDIDLFRLFETVQVNMTITTDSERVRRAFEPHCSTNNKRLQAIARVASAGVNTAITMTPLLPVEDPRKFADDLLATGVDKFVVQPFHAEGGRFVAGTREGAVAIERDLGWTPAAYRRTVEILRDQLPSLKEGREGFAPI